MAEPPVINASPLIHFGRTDHLSLLTLMGPRRNRSSSPGSRWTLNRHGAKVAKAIFWAAPARLAGAAGLPASFGGHSSGPRSVGLWVPPRALRCTPSSGRSRLLMG